MHVAKVEVIQVPWLVRPIASNRTVFQRPGKMAIKTNIMIMMTMSMLNMTMVNLMVLQDLPQVKIPTSSLYTIPSRQPMNNVV